MVHSVAVAPRCSLAGALRFCGLGDKKNQMASVDVVEREGSRSIKLTLEDEAVHVEAGALASVEGNIDVEVNVPSIPRIFRSVLSEEAILRPRCEGSGVIFLEPSFGGFHVIDVNNEGWILERGTYWASEGGVDLALHREPVWTSLRTGEGFVDYKTKLTGTGKAIFNTIGPVDEISLDDQMFLIEEDLVIGRTDGLAYKVRYVGRSLWSKLLSNEKVMRLFEGTGKVLITRAPFYRMRLLKAAERKSR
jgi:uncharacterized protein (AIM24 family)